MSVTADAARLAARAMWAVGDVLDPAGWLGLSSSAFKLDGWANQHDTRPAR